MTFTLISHPNQRRWRVLLVASALALTACSAPSTESTLSNGVATGEESESVNLADAAASDTVQGNAIATGTFEGLSDHITTGGVAIIESDGRYFVQLADDFSLDGAPDPKVGLGKEGYDPMTQAGALKSIQGASFYELSTAIKLEDYNEVYIWCEKFGVPLGVARLERV